MSSIEKSRKLRLRACESVLIQHGKQWVAVGEALMEIRDGDLYKEDGFTSWPKYLAENEAKFGIGSESHANRYIKASRVAPSLPKPTRPTGGSGWSIAHAEQLDRLDTNAQAGKLAKALLTDGKPPTVSVVKKAVDKALGIKPPKKQKAKAAVSPTFSKIMLSYIDSLRDMADILDKLSAAECRVFGEEEPGLTADLVKQIERVQKILTRVWNNLP